LGIVADPRMHLQPRKFNTRQFSMFRKQHVRRGFGRWTAGEPTSRRSPSPPTADTAPTANAPPPQKNNQSCATHTEGPHLPRNQRQRNHSAERTQTGSAIAPVPSPADVRVPSPAPRHQRHHKAPPPTLPYWPTFSGSAGLQTGCRAGVLTRTLRQRHPSPTTDSP
jgi:hypothetical protein